MTRPFDTILIANRGEIACRIIRSAREQGLRCVAVYTDADRHAPHVAMADDARNIGAGPVGDSYLDGAKIIAAARESGAQAIHPGYGFLSENAGFARAVDDAGLVFIGPEPQAIEAMGDKSAAKRAMIAAGVACVPGYEGADQSDEALIAEASRIGFPIMIKASAGGGGRGMRRVSRTEDMAQALPLARAESLSAFGSDHLILERAIDKARHVEIQIFADRHGNCVHLGERDCSVQRRHQKVIEESPCPVLTPDLRAAMGDAAIRAAKAVDYVGAGTVEFLLDPSGAFYFLEMNTRLQVEHPVTEMVTGLDLVALQLQVAQGAPLGLDQSDVEIHGHAMEIRLYAEDPAAGFMPSTGVVTNWTAPVGEGIRVDAGITSGQEVSPHYDPMLAKVIAHGPTRETARKRLLRALYDTGLLGVATNRGFLIELLEQPDFVNGNATTTFLDDAYPDGPPQQDPDSRAQAIAAALHLNQMYRAARDASPLTDDGFYGLGALPTPVDLRLGDTVYQMRATAIQGGWRVEAPTPDTDWAHDVRITSPHLTLDGQRVPVHVAQGAFSMGAESWNFEPHQPWLNAGAQAGSGRICAPMPGVVTAIETSDGARIEAGQTIAVIEAMKMQHQVVADISGTVEALAITKGQQLTAGQLICSIAEETP